jgi:hypothetical protein
MNGSAAEVIDQIDDSARMSEWSHIAVTRGRRLAETAEVNRIAIDLIAQGVHEICPVQRRTAEPVDEDRDRKARARGLGVPDGEGAMRQGHIEARPRRSEHGFGHGTRLPN